jgi:demethylmenaquinone methyltransferase/2-methoxy-6-polyprenyl-1,4-benzoquinol methylase
VRPIDLAYGRRVYDWWGRHPRIYRASTAAIVFLGRERALRQAAVDSLGLAEGATVLDLACGHGVNFRALERAIGPTGRLIALDYSEGMLAVAAERAGAEGWANVELVEADAAHAELGEQSLDGAVCTLALSAIPDHYSAIANVRAALRPGARFAVLDAKLFPGLGRPLNPLLKAAFRHSTNWDYQRDVVADLLSAFGEIEVAEHNGGSLFLAVATR